MGARRGRTQGRRRPQQVLAIPKEPLANEIRRLVAEKGLSRAEAALLVEDAASQMSLLLTGKLRGFSVDRLVRTLLHLGREVEVVVKPSSRPRRAKRATVRVITREPRRRVPGR